MFLGIAAMYNQQFGKALEYFRLLTEIEPDFAEGWNKRATVFYLM
jgi:Flp pilus assembly protein TadD